MAVSDSDMALNEDWLRSMHWDLYVFDEDAPNRQRPVTTYSDLLDYLDVTDAPQTQQRQAVERFMETPAAIPMPETLRQQVQQQLQRGQVGNVKARSLGDSGSTDTSGTGDATDTEDHAQLQGYEVTLAAAVFSVLSKYQDVVIREIMQRTGGDTRNILDRKAFLNDLRAALYPVLYGIALTAVYNLQDENGLAVDDALMAADVGIWLADYLDQLLPGLADTTQTVIGTAQEQAKTLVQAGTSLTPAILLPLLTGAFSQRRANTIGITETTSAISGGTHVFATTIAKQGVTVEKHWKTAEDEKVCPACAPLDNLPEAKYAIFHPDGPPAHPRCRCRIDLRTTEHA